MSGDPQRVLVAGDWHGNLKWAAAVVGMLPDLLPDESPRTIVHVGDFGIWPGRAGERYLAELNDMLHGANARLWFVDGNHEDHSQLRHHSSASVFLRGGRDIARNIRWLPRGVLWDWHGRRWVAAGGAVSVDRAFRREGRDWWPEEEISEADHRRIVEAASSHGPNGLVLLCHDAPTSVPMTFGEWPCGWDVADKARADAHRDRLQAIVDEVEPTHLFHGHYHRWHDLTVPQHYGDLRVIGLDMDDSLAGNYRVLNVKTMELESMVGV